MECKFEIISKVPDTRERLFRPYVQFRLIQLNLSSDCFTDGEIDFEINALVKKVEELRKKVKKELRAAQLRHDKLIEEMNKKGNDDI